MKKRVYLLITALQLLLLWGSYMIYRLSITKMGVMRHIVYTNQKWEAAYPMTLIMNIGFLAVAIGAWWVYFNYKKINAVNGNKTGKNKSANKKNAPVGKNPKQIAKAKSKSNGAKTAKQTTKPVEPMMKAIPMEATLGLFGVAIYATFMSTQTLIAYYYVGGILYLIMGLQVLKAYLVKNSKAS